MVVPDLNLLIYAIDADSVHHDRAKPWLRALLEGAEPVGIPWVVALGFIRISTRQGIFSRPLSATAALEIVAGWLDRRIVSSIEPGSSHFTILRQLLADGGTAGNRTTDAHLAALCIERGATLHTADSDFHRFRQLRVLNPLYEGR